LWRALDTLATYYVELPLPSATKELDSSGDVVGVECDLLLDDRRVLPQAPDDKVDNSSYNLLP